MTKKIAFISHSSKDSDVANTICNMLELRGIDCWIAPRDIAKGKHYPEEIVKGIEGSEVTILVLSENANESKHVCSEIQIAVNKGKTVYPVRIRKVSPSKSLEFHISTSQWLDAWQPPMDIKIDQLASSIRHLVGLHECAITPPAAPSQNRNAISSEATEKIRPSKEEKLLIRNYFRFNNTFERASTEVRIVASQRDEFNTHYVPELVSEFEFFGGVLLGKRDGHELCIEESLKIPACYEDPLWAEDEFLGGLVLEPSRYWADGVEDWLMSLQLNYDITNLLFSYEYKNENVLILPMAHFSLHIGLCYCLKYMGLNIEVHLTDGTNQECSFELPAIFPRPFIFGNGTYILFPTEISDQQLNVPVVTPLSIDAQVMELFVRQLRKLNAVLKHNRLHLKTRIDAAYRAISIAVNELCEAIPKRSQIALDQRRLTEEIGLNSDSESDCELREFVVFATKIAFWREGVAIIDTNWEEGSDFYYYSPNKLEVSLAIAQIIPPSVIRCVEREPAVITSSYKGPINISIKGRLNISAVVPWLREILLQGKKETRNELTDAIPTLAFDFESSDLRNSQG